MRMAWKMRRRVRVEIDGIAARQMRRERKRWMAESEEEINVAEAREVRSREWIVEVREVL
jgi:hypothetical protein